MPIVELSPRDRHSCAKTHFDVLFDMKISGDILIANVVSMMAKIVLETKLFKVQNNQALMNSPSN